MAVYATTIARNKNNDLYLDSHGNIAMVSGRDAYAQIINAKMKTSRGEMQLNIDKGIPYFQTVFADPNLANIWESEILKMLLSLPFVIDVVSFDYEVSNNMIKYKAEIKTDEGIIISNG
jgi:aspartate/tyrosine/aromatic aminotransferase